MKAAIQACYHQRNVSAVNEDDIGDSHMGYKDNWRNRLKRSVGSEEPRTVKFPDNLASFGAVQEMSFI
jgi:hypothetical protein